MIVKCTECRQNNVIPDDRVPEDNFIIMCKSCKAILAVDLRVSTVKMLKLEPEKAQAGPVDRASPNYDISKDPIYATCGKDSLERVVLDKFIEGDVELPVLPNIATQIFALVRDEKTTAKTLARAIQVERAIAARILKLANSAFYKSVEPVKDLEKAVARLGFKTVESTVVGAVTNDIFKTKVKFLAEIMQTDWDNAVTSAIAASEIAREVKYKQPETAFAAGLLHNIGHVVGGEILAHIPADELKRYDINRDAIVHLLDDLHVPLGCALLVKWNIPGELVRAVAYHCEPEEVEDVLVDIVHLANGICIKIGKDLISNTDLSLTGLISAQRLGFNDVKLASMLVDLEDKVRDMKSVLA